MALKKLLATFGVGSADVETVLDNPNVTPGGAVQGQVHIKGGSVQQEIDRVSVALVARVEVEAGDEEHHTRMRFHQEPLSGSFTLQPDQRFSAPFTLQVPWETPITVAYGTALRGMQVGVETELEIERGVDSTDLDPVAVHPLPPHERILDAFRTLGFRFHRADLEQGRVRQSGQTLPFYQELEFYAPSRYGGVKEVEVTFITSATGLEIILELDKRTMLGGSHDSVERLGVDAAGYAQVDWERELHELISKAGRHRGFSW